MKASTPTVIARLALILGLALTLAVSTPVAPASAHDDPAYSHGSSTGATNTDWMAGVAGNTPLSELSIPGTHDSGAFVWGGDITETQGMDIDAQLDAGIRFFDIRLGYGSLCPQPTLWVYHGDTCQFVKFTERVLDPMVTFLDTHKNETILMRIKQDHGDELATDFPTSVRDELTPYASYLYTGTSLNPDLNALRGKIIIFRNYNDDTAPLSTLTTNINWASGPDIQDNYSMGDSWDLANKWRLAAPDANGNEQNVRDQLIDANDMSDDASVIHINFLSASGGDFPYFFASGHWINATNADRRLTGWTTIDCGLYNRCIDEYPRVSCAGTLCSVAFEGINILARDYIVANVHNRAGIVIADFPGSSLISAIINVNPTNAPPTVTATGSTIDENGTATVSGTITDPDVGDTFSLSIDWGEGSPSVYSYPAGTTTYSVSHQYLDDNPTGTPSDVYPISVTVTDNKDGSGSATTSVTVNNVAPVVTATGSTIDENGAATVSGSITDPGTQDTFVVTIDWGEGAPVDYAYPAGSTSYSEQHQYLDDNPTATATDTYAIGVTVTDDDTGVGTASTSVTVNNVAPTVTATGSTIDENGAATVSGSITDPGTLDTFVVTIDWGEGAPVGYAYPAGSTSYSEQHQYLDDNPTATATDTYAIGVTVTDDDTGVGIASTSVTVNNVAPVVTATGSTIDENGAATVSGSITDPGTQDTFVVTIDWGEGAPVDYAYPSGTTSYSEQHQYLDDNPTGTPSDVYPISVTVTDDDTGVGIASTSVTVNNIAPLVTATGSTIDENGAATVSGSITDPGTLDTFVVTIDWGEGSPVNYSYPAGSTLYSEQHQYLDDNPTGTPSDVYPISVTVTDDDTGVGGAATSVTVNNVAPVASFDWIMDSQGNLIGPVPPNVLDIVLEGLDLSISVSFSDVGTQDTHAALIDWGDGGTWTGPVTSPVGGAYVFATAGIYQIAVTVTDDDTGAVTVSRDIEVVTPAGAVEDAIGDLLDVLADPNTDPAVAALIVQALEELGGQNGGAAMNGALDKINEGAWNAALVKLRKAVELLEAAGQDATASQLVLVAKAIVVDLTDRAEAAATTPRQQRAVSDARALIAEGDAAPTRTGAIDAYQRALIAIRPG